MEHNNTRDYTIITCVTQAMNTLQQACIKQITSTMLQDIRLC